MLLSNDGGRRMMGIMVRDPSLALRVRNNCIEASGVAEELKRDILRIT